MINYICLTSVYYGKNGKDKPSQIYIPSKATLRLDKDTQEYMKKLSNSIMIKKKLLHKTQIMKKQSGRNKITKFSKHI